MLMLLGIRGCPAKGTVLVSTDGEYEAGLLQRFKALDVRLVYLVKLGKPLKVDVDLGHPGFSTSKVHGETAALGKKTANCFLCDFNIGLYRFGRNFESLVLRF